MILYSWLGVLGIVKRGILVSKSRYEEELRHKEREAKTESV